MQINKLQIIRTLSQTIFSLITILALITDLKYFMIIVLISMIIGGTFFCGWFCPFGFMQDLIIKIRNLFGIKKIYISKKYHKYLVFSRYIISILAVAGITFLFTIDARISFLMLLEGEVLSTIAYSSIVIFLLIGLFIDRLFCNYFCFEGMKYGLFSTFRFVSIKRDKNKCIDCKKCDRICPMNIQVSTNKNVRSLQCINCFRCISNCPKKDCLKYGLIKKDDYNFFK